MCKPECEHDLQTAMLWAAGSAGAGRREKRETAMVSWTSLNTTLKSKGGSTLRVHDRGTFHKVWWEKPSFAHNSHN